MYHPAFREAALRVYTQFGSMRRAAAVLSISVASLSRWLHDLQPKTWHRPPSKMVESVVKASSAYLRSTTVCSSLELVAHLQTACDVSISRQLALCIMRRLGYTFKPARKRFVAVKIDPAAALARRTSFYAEFSNALDAGLVVAVDESGFDQRATPLYAFAPKGEPAILTCPTCRDHRRVSQSTATVQSRASRTQGPSTALLLHASSGPCSSRQERRCSSTTRRFTKPPASAQLQTAKASGSSSRRRTLRSSTPSSLFLAS